RCAGRHACAGTARWRRARRSRRPDGRPLSPGADAGDQQSDQSTELLGFQRNPDLAVLSDTYVGHESAKNRLRSRHSILIHAQQEAPMRATMLILSVAAFSLQSSPQYQITHTYTLGGDGSWDYVVPDSPHHRLFIGRQDRVMVVDENTGSLIGNVTGIKGAHGTAIAASTGHGFATSGQDA